MPKLSNISKGLSDLERRLSAADQQARLTAEQVQDFVTRGLGDRLEGAFARGVTATEKAQAASAMRQAQAIGDLAKTLSGAIQGVQEGLSGLAERVMQLDQAISERLDGSVGEVRQAVLDELSGISASVRALPTSFPAIPETDLSLVERMLADIAEKVHEEPVVVEQPVKWVFEIEREAFSDRINRITARKG